MRELDIEVPVAADRPDPGVECDALFDALFGPRAARERSSWILNAGRLALHATRERALTLHTPGPARATLEVDGSHDVVASVVPGLGDLAPTAIPALQSFLAGQLVELDHIGINLASVQIDEQRFRGFLDDVDRHWPVYLLDVPGGNVIAIAVAGEQGGGSGRAVQALEIVHDRRQLRSSLHVCARVASNRTETERAFPAPFGAYKPGDEAFFRSVTVTAGIGVPFYLDLAFADAPFPRWTEIVAAMGRRWH